MKIAVYPGSFDPITNGHVDVIERSAKIFDTIYVSILKNYNKKPFFSVEERKDQIIRATSHIPNVKVDYFDGLLVNYMKGIGASVIIKGLRAVSDFEYEFQMALTNRKLDPEIETLFMMASAQNQYLSSSIVREVARFGGSLDGLVPPVIQDEIMKKAGEFR